MITVLGSSARRRPASEEPLVAELGAVSYADSFELETPGPDDHTAERWMRCALEESPRWLRAVVLFAWRVALGFRLGPRGSADHILGWRIVINTPEAVQFEASSRLMRGVLIGRRSGASAARVTTALIYRRPRAAGIVWTVVGPVHRLVAPYLLDRTARRLGHRLRP